MARTAVIDREGSERDEIELNENIFEAEFNEALIHQAVVSQLNAKRAGSASTKTRREVAGGGRKPWRQKGTGRARHGSIRSPLWVGGGVVFGPKPKKYKNRMPKRAKRQALRSALSAKFQNEELVVLDELEFDVPRTKDMIALLEKLGLEGISLVLVIPERDRSVEKSASNIPDVSVVTASHLSVYDVLAHERVAFTRRALEKVEEVLA